MLNTPEFGAVQPEPHGPKLHDLARSRTQARRFQIDGDELDLGQWVVGGDDHILLLVRDGTKLS